MLPRFVLSSVFVVLLMSWMPIDDQTNLGNENSPPKVTITNPVKTSRFRWNSIIPYAIAVVDKEDGNSAYDEIPVQQVFMTIRYLPDSAQLKNYLRVESRVYQEVLVQMSTTTCFNCHQMKSKLIGPSFESISKKYPNTEASIVSLADKVIKGSVGTWGDVQMPPHPDLKPAQVQQIVRWIIKNGSDPDQDHLRGIDGTFRTREKPPIGSARSVYILTATYADSGDNATIETRKVGQQTIVLKSMD